MAPPSGTYPAPVLCAALLAAEDASLVLAGSAALWLHSEPQDLGPDLRG